MKTALLALSLAFAPALASRTAVQPPSSPSVARIGFVSGQRIFVESSEGKTEAARLQTLQQQKTTDLRAKQQTLEATRQQLAQGGDSATRERLQQQEQQQRTDLERATVQAQTELQTLQRQVQSEFQTRVKPIVEAVAKSENVQLVLNGDSAVVWAAPGMDLTKMVLDRLNAKP